MLKLYRFTLGTDESYGAYSSLQEAYEKRADIDATFFFTPVAIEEVLLPGFTITVTKEGEDGELPLEIVKSLLKGAGIKFPPNTGETRLRELAKEHL